MQPNYLPLARIFGLEVRHTVPLFQRPYVWSRDEQWEPLWQDISRLADRVLQSSEGKPIAGHFLGTVVLEQAPSRAGSIGRREIIDGQQRLTTLQILLHALQHALALLAKEQADAGQESLSRKVDVAARQVQALTTNPAYEAEEEKYKVWPTNTDRAPFREVMDANSPEELQAVQTTMADAYRYFQQAIHEWLHLADVREARAVAFASAVKDHLRLIVLDLDDTDEPQAIFETLNANGAPLLPADLMKNWLLWEAVRQKIVNIKELYEKYWQTFDVDADFWRTKIGTGHAARARVDTLLQNWLTRRTREAVASKHLYDGFLNYAAPRNAAPDTVTPAKSLQALMADIHTDGIRFREINAPTGKTRFDTFLRRLGMLDFVAFHPLLLELMSRSGSSSVDRDASAVILESFLVRRTICWEETRGYGNLVIDLLQALAAEGERAPAAPTLLAKLVTLADGPNRWPNDERFRDAWCRQKFYGGIRRSRVMMILQALEEHYQTAGTKGEPIVAFDFANLEIEHILPQKWERHWPLPAAEDARANREHVLHGIGNLTLVSGKLNPTLSNAAWLNNEKGTRGKWSALDEHAKLQMNNRIVRNFPHVWNEITIRERAVELFAAARKVWPDSHALTSVA
jgi:hypothetical protein